MTLQSSGAISIGDICDEGDWNKGGLKSRASFSEMKEYTSIAINANDRRMSEWYGYTHPDIKIDSTSYVAETNTTITYRFNCSVVNDDTSRNQGIVLRIRENLGNASSFSVITGSTSQPSYVDPDNITWGSIGDPVAEAESTLFTVGVGVTSFNFILEIPKKAASYSALIDLIRTKGDDNDDHYKLNAANVNPNGTGSGIQRITQTIPALPLLYSWESTAFGNLEPNPCNPLVYAENMYSFKDSGAGLANGDIVYENNNLTSLIPLRGGSYGVRRNSVKYSFQVLGANGVISNVSLCP